MHRTLLRNIRARPRLLAALAVGVVFYWIVPLATDLSTRLLMAWNIAASAFVVMAISAMIRSTHDVMKERAQSTDEGRFAVLALSMAAATVSLAAIVVELSRIKGPANSDIHFYVGLSVLTIFVSWSFIQIIFTEQYAHEYYIERDGQARPQGQSSQGLAFPSESKPDYIDFLYFTVTIGVANQTADVAIRSRPMRVLVLIHSVISYFFNATILALGINIVSSIL
jgi:uncharacterized membrane protein